MKIEVFKNIIENLNQQRELEDKLYKLGIDLLNINDSYSKIVSNLIGTIYGKEGLDVFDWWVYEKESEEHYYFNEVKMETIDEIYNWLESNKTDDYELPHRVFTTEEFESILKGFGKMI